jgi:hypothetical protein
VAPGRSILSTMPTYAVTIPAALNYDRLDGTSMATPCVTGLVALMWSRHPGFTNTRIRECLTSSAVKLGAGSFDNTWGFGRIDAEKALRCGDLVFTPFTRFTEFTRFTIPPITLFTEFTRFTFPTRFTIFTRFTPFTRPFTEGPGPGPEPFVRFRNTIFEPEELALRRFEDFADIADALGGAGLEGLDQLACADAGALAGALGLGADEVAPLIDSAQQHLRQLAGTH